MTTSVALSCLPAWRLSPSLTRRKTECWQKIGIGEPPPFGLERCRTLYSMSRPIGLVSRLGYLPLNPGSVVSSHAFPFSSSPFLSWPSPAVDCGFARQLAPPSATGEASQQEPVPAPSSGDSQSSAMEGAPLMGSDAVGGPRVLHPTIGMAPQGDPLRDTPSEQAEAVPLRSEVAGAHKTQALEGAATDVDEEDPGALTASILGEIRQLALPALGSCLADPLMSLIDSCCVGQIGSIQLASLGPNTAIFNFVFQVFGFLGISTTSMLAALSATTSEPPHLAQRKAARTLSVALTLAMLLGLLALVVLEGQGALLLRAMGASTELLGPGLQYLRIRALSAPAVLVLVVGQGACLGCQDARTPLVIFLGAGLLNVVGDILLTLHLRWGVSGAAWATVAAQYCGAAVFLYKLADRRPTQPVSPLPAQPESRSGPAERSSGGRRRVRRVGPPFQLEWGALPSSEEAQALVAVGGTLVLRSLCGMVVYTMLAYVATSLGTLQIASHQIAMQLFWFLSYFPEPLSISAQSLVARDRAAEPQRARVLARMLVLAGCCIGLVLGGVVWLIPRVWGHVLAADVRVRQGVLAVSLQNALCSWLCSMAIVLDGVAIGSGDYAYMPRMQFFIMLAVAGALRVSWGAGWGLAGVWHCLTLFFVLRIAYHAVHIASNAKTHVLGW